MKVLKKGEKNPENIPKVFDFLIFFLIFLLFRKIGICFGNRLIADCFHDQTIFLKDYELYIIGHSLVSAASAKWILIDLQLLFQSNTEELNWAVFYWLEDQWQTGKLSYYESTFVGKVEVLGLPIWMNVAYFFLLLVILSQSLIFFT